MILDKWILFPYHISKCNFILNFEVFCISLKRLNIFFLTFRAVASGGARGQLSPLSPSPWIYSARHIKSVDGVLFFRLSYFDYSDLQLFAIFSFEVDFSETYLMTSAENSVPEPLNLKILWKRISPDPPTRLLPPALAIITVSDINIYITEIVWWGLKRILSSRFRDVQKSAKSQNLE